jgi:hypothetical protein
MISNHVYNGLHVKSAFPYIQQDASVAFSEVDVSKRVDSAARVLTPIFACRRSLNVLLLVRDDRPLWRN